MPRHTCTLLNVASGTETPVLALAEAIRSMTAPEKKITCRGIARPGDPHRWCADLRRLRSLLPAWQPQELPAALHATIRQWHTRPA